jgi:hypothetical protein
LDRADRIRKRNAVPPCIGAGRTDGLIVGVGDCNNTPVVVVDDPDFLCGWQKFMGLSAFRYYPAVLWRDFCGTLTFDVDKSVG